MPRSFSFGLSSEQENDYRQSRLLEDVKLVTLGLVVVIIGWVSFLFNDYQFLGFSEQFLSLVVLRFGLSIATLVVLFLIKRFRTYWLFDRTIFVWAVILIVTMLAVNATRPPGFIAHSIIAAIIILAVGFLLPTRFTNQIILVAICAIGETILVSVSAIPITVLFTVIFSLITVSIITVVCSYRLHVSRRRNYQSIVELDKMEKKIEDYARNLEKLVAEKTEELKCSERLAAIGITAGMVGHDIRNPLQSILSELFLAKSEIDSLEDGELRNNLLESLNHAEKDILYIDKIVKDLQDYSRQLLPSNRFVDVKEVINESLSQNNLANTIQVSVSVVDDARTVYCDPDLLKRALTNLIANSVQAMPKGGELRINVYPDEAGCVIAVKDTGIGIPEEVRDKVFTPLFTTKAKGQGLGLAVVKRIAEASGGSITFESEKEVGTTFFLRLPLK